MVTSTPGNFLSILDFDADVHLTRLVYFTDVHLTRLVYFTDVHLTRLVYFEDVHLTRLVYFADVHLTRLVYFEDVHSTRWYILKMFIRHSEFVNLEFNMFKPNQYIRYTIYTRLTHAYQPINEKEIMSIRRVQSTLLHQIYIYQIHVHYFRFAVSRDFPMWSTSNLIKAEHNTTYQTRVKVKYCIYYI